MLSDSICIERETIYFGLRYWKPCIRRSKGDYWLWFTIVLVVVGVKLAAAVVETGHGWGFG
ncbi:hypothetical protein HanRHA438_Chr04g0151581 [Helianthus annuus]|nr:hypothetical protein HanIR_Chr04g0151631 [Helianthus annuus]KAJ0924714.1 hypothetical protein HanRHA438_Chr04g0151581 [Helianthus annuus]